ncbi:MAG: orotate phosphoribosyltransferase [Chitinophagaceae bacterium]|nr:orotate phosphoribosyltransferase [Chitinophagaceae bacterium]
MSADIFLAEQLLDIKTIKVNVQQPYQWASGWKSPVYCDNRKVLAHPKVRSFIVTELCNTIKTKFVEVDLIAGVATAGIPWGALVANELNLPFCYVRPQPKSHGLNNQVEGDYATNQKVVVIEDLISTGKSSIKVIEVLQQLELNVNGLVSIFNYGFVEATEAFRVIDVPFFSITNFNALLQKAIEKNIIQEKDLAVIKDWQQNPATWNTVVTK